MKFPLAAIVNRNDRPHPDPTAIELSELRWTWSAEFIPLPADLAEPEGGGLKSALLNSTAVHPGPLRESGKQAAPVQCSMLDVGCWMLTGIDPPSPRPPGEGEQCTAVGRCGFGGSGGAPGGGSGGWGAGQVGVAPLPSRAPASPSPGGRGLG